MHVRKARAGAGAGFVWAHDGAVVEVPDHIGHDLLCIPDGGFSEYRPDTDPDPGTIPPELVDLVTRTVDRRVADAVTELSAQLDRAVDRAIAAKAAHAVDQAVAVRLAGQTLTGPGSAVPDPVSPPDASGEQGAAGAPAPELDASGTPGRAATTRSGRR